MHCPDFLAIELHKFIIRRQERGTAAANQDLGMVDNEDATVNEFHNKGKERLPSNELTQLVFKLVRRHDFDNIRAPRRKQR
jgi:hypothetical protein